MEKHRRCGDPTGEAAVSKPTPQTTSVVSASLQTAHRLWSWTSSGSAT